MKKSISIILSLFIVFCFGGTAFADQITDAQKKQNEINRSINDKNDKIKDINKSSETVRSDLNKLNSQMGTVSKKLTNLNIQIAETNVKIAETEKELKVREDKLKEEEELYLVRMRAIYMQGSTSYMEVLLDFKSFSDMISRMEFVKKINDYDRNLIKSLNEERLKVEQAKQELEGNKKQVVALKQQADAQYKNLQVKAQEKNNLEASLQKDKSHYEEMIAAEEAQSQQIQKKIVAFNKSLEASKAPKATEVKNTTSKSPVSNPSRGGSFNSGGSSSILGTRGPITSPYGPRTNPYTGFHHGIDIGVSVGTPIYSLKAGTVMYINDPNGYGNALIVNHGDISSLYGHCSSLVVSNGQKVSAGQLIAYSGNSGHSTGPHLHFEVRNSQGESIDSTPYY